MKEDIIDSEIFENCDFTISRLSPGVYDSCYFRNCSFNESDLSGLTFSECEFNGCDLSLAKVHNTGFKDARFTACKLLGVHFDDCDKLLLSFDFENCNLDLVSFCKLKMKGHSFRSCSLREADFTEADLTASIFSNCDLGRAVFELTILEKADLSSSFNFIIDPEKNRIRKARFSLQGIPGLLNKYDLEIE